MSSVLTSAPLVINIYFPVKMSDFNALNGFFLWNNLPLSSLVTFVPKGLSEALHHDRPALYLHGECTRGTSIEEIGRNFGRNCERMLSVSGSLGIVWTNAIYSIYEFGPIGTQLTKGEVRSGFGVAPVENPPHSSVLLNRMLGELFHRFSQQYPLGVGIPVPSHAM